LLSLTSNELTVGLIRDILQSKKKPKEKVSLLVKKVRKDINLLDEVVRYFEVGSTAEKGSCIEVMEYVSQDKPDLILPYLDFIIKHINDDAPRVKWETARVIGNLSSKYQDEVSKSIEKLFLNTKDKGTVVRWSAAFALTEIAKNNSKLQEKLTQQFNQIIKKEDNNGVKNVYLKALKILE